MSVTIKRVYDRPAPRDGIRVLVDRLWPRGLSKTQAKIDRWMKELAPSEELRRWFAHKSERWEGFQTKYRGELKEPEQQRLLKELRTLARTQPVTLVFAAKDTRRNNAVVLARVLRSTSRFTSSARRSHAKRT